MGTEDAVLLKEWDFARFFPNKFPNSDSKNIDNQNKKSSDIKKEPLIASGKKENVTELNKITNPFFRGFRRENTDFFPLSARHSAIYLDRNAQPAGHNVNRSSGFFQRKMSTPNKNADPVLMDFSNIDTLRASSIEKDQKNKDGNSRNGSKRASSGAAQSFAFANKSNEAQKTPPQNAAKRTTKDNNGATKNLDFMRPRREKTESYIVLRNSVTRQQLLANQVILNCFFFHHNLYRLLFSSYFIFFFVIYAYCFVISLCKNFSF